jgi:hypothetical protein
VKGSKQLAAVALAALGLAGAGVAVAAVGTSDGEVTAPTTTLPESTTTVPEPTTTTTTPAPVTTLAPVTDEVPDGDEPDGGVARSTEGCDGQEYKNHGEYVSSVARSDEREPGGVSDAAQSPCGKPLASIHGEEPDLPEEVDPPEETTTEPAPPGPGHAPGSPPGKALGRGRS